ncbi:MAG: magnesium transporter [Oscillospiraceae bacterium]|nr:magnesium transporter [Oscillospiraceae bacterium]
MILEKQYDELLQLLKDKKYGILHGRLSQMNASDISEFLEEYVPQDGLVLTFRLTQKDKGANAFAYLSSEIQEAIIKGISDREVGDLVNELYTDDAADMIEELPANVVKRVMRNVDSDTRDLINRFLQYPENSAGSIMTAEFVDLKKNMTVAESFARIRKIGEDKETLYTMYVVDGNRKLEGVIEARDLLLSDHSAVIDEIMHTNIISVNTHDDQEKVSELFSRYDLLAIPVVDMEQRLVGIVTVDDIIDVMEQEATEDFELMAAMTPSEKPYLKTGVFTLAKNRVLWLMLLMISATVTGSILLHYEEAFLVVPLLVALMPMLTDTGGNAGCQSSTLIIRGMAVGEIYPRDILLVLWKELRVSLLCGLALAAINFARVLVVYPGEVQVAFVVSIALVATVIMAKVVGCVLPIAAKVCKLDPAIMAAPLITTLVDAGALLLYFEIARIILKI